MEAKTRFSPTTAIAIVVANMIGTGVFTSLGFQLADIDSGFVILLLWALGGLVALCGALCYAELGARLPRSGGEYNFLAQIYHPCAGFISGWISATVGFAAPTALAAITFGTYLAAVFPQLSALWLATGLIAATTVVHATSHRNSAGLQVVFTAAKVALILLFSIAALVSVEQIQDVDFLPERGDLTLIGSGGFAVALIYVGYAYSGWNAATYLTGELEAPEKTLPLVLAAGTALVMIAYLLLNAVFLIVAPMDQMAGQLEIGYIAARHAFGALGADIMGITLALLLISTVSAMMIAAPRVLQVLGEDYRPFRFLARLNHNQVPAVAVYSQGILALVFLWSASFDRILVFSGATMALNTLFTVLGLMILRHRDQRGQSPGAARFKVPWYPLPALIFLLVTGATLAYLAIERPVEILFSLGLIGTGALAYLLSRPQGLLSKR